MEKTPTNLKKRFKLRKINHMVVGGALAVTLVLAPMGYALVAFVDPGFLTMITTQLTKLNSESIIQTALQKSIDAAQQALQNKLSEAANKLSGAIQGKLDNAVKDKLGKITGGPVGTLLNNSGLKLKDVDGPNVVGHVDSAAVEKQILDQKKNTNPVDAITAQTAIMLENQLHDRLNVTSVLDEKPAAGACKSTSNCTILTLLREQDAVALSDLQKVNMAAIGYQVSQKGSWDKSTLDKIYSITGKDSINVLNFLTPSNAIPLGFERNPQTAANLEKSMWLSQVIVGGKNDAQFLTEEMQDKNFGDSANQLDAMAKIAKVQLARGAIMNVHNENLHNALNSQFRACVVRPDTQDRVGATQEQQLVHIQSLMRCNNMILLQMRQQELESQRLLGTMLLTLLDLYAVQEPTKQK